MGLPQNGRQLYMRPSYLQSRDILALFKDADLYVDKLFWSVVHLVLANYSVLCT